MTLQIDFLPWDCGMKLGRLAIPCGYWTCRRTDRPTVLSISRTLVLEGLIVLCERWLRSSPSDQSCRFRVSTLALYSAPRWCKLYFLECVYIYICMYIYILYIYAHIYRVWTFWIHQMVSRWIQSPHGEPPAHCLARTSQMALVCKASRSRNFGRKRGVGMWFSDMFGICCSVEDPPK
jgi:hypothetical protein